MPVMEFTTNKQQNRATATLTLDGVEYTVRAPKQGAIVRLASAATANSWLEQVNAGLGFVWSCLDPKDRVVLQARVDDPDDDLDLDFLVEDVLGKLIEEFVARPTTSSSASTRRRSPTKKRSTGTSPSTGLTAAG